MARTKSCVRRRRPQIAKKTIRRKLIGSTNYPSDGVYTPNLRIHLNPARRIQHEYRLHRRRRQPRIRNQSIRKSQQCISQTLQRRQCKKRTAHTQKCWIHLAKYDNLRIKPSNIPNAGKGLFAWKKSIPRDKKISPYTGRLMSQRAIDAKYGDGLAEYAICDRGNCIDANYTTDAAARFANDARGTAYRKNADLRGSGRRYNFYLKSTKRIKPHQEIFTSYGADYWNKKY